MTQLIVTIFILAALGAASALDIDAASCATPPTPQVTFNTACPSVSFDPSCWTPRVPLPTDTVLFPAKTKAVVPFVNGSYTAFVVAGIVIDANAEVTMNGAGAQISGCFIVNGALNIEAVLIDNGSIATAPYAADPTVPEGTDCRTVPAGFTPRVCGPGQMRITSGGVVTLSGLYASLFISTTVEAGGTLTAGSSAFIWANTTVEAGGRITSIGVDGTVFLHGSLNNSGSVTLGGIRADKWATLYTTPSRNIIVNNAAGATFELVGAKAPPPPPGSGGGEPLSFLVSTEAEYEFEQVNYQVKLINSGSVTFSNVPKYASFSGQKIDIFNFGTMTWLNAVTRSIGTTINIGGTVIADNCTVYLSDYLSDGGNVMTRNGGSFEMGNGAGIDPVISHVCTKKTRPANSDIPHRLRVVPKSVFDNKTATCDPSNPWSCPDAPTSCCDATGTCRPTNCGVYDGRPSCCFHNAGCQGSSHGPYCGNDRFVWDLDSTCLDSVAFVDRYEFESIRKFFVVEPPKFGRQRYSFRGNSTVAGTIVFSEPIEVRGTVTVAGGGRLQSVIDNGDGPMRGDGTIRVMEGGHMVSGIKATYDGRANVEVLAGGVFSVPRYSRVQLDMASARLTVAPGAEMRVDGKLFLMGDADGKAPSVRQCGSLKGPGSVVGNAVDTWNSPC